MTLSIKVADNVINLNYNNLFKAKLDMNEFNTLIEQADSIAGLLGAERIPAKHKEMLHNMVKVYTNVIGSSQGIFEISVNEETGRVLIETHSTMSFNIKDIKEAQKVYADYKSETSCAQDQEQDQEQPESNEPIEEPIEDRLERHKQKLNSLLITNDGSLYDKSVIETLQRDIQAMEDLININQIATERKLRRATCAQINNLK